MSAADQIVRRWLFVPLPFHLPPPAARLAGLPAFRQGKVVHQTVPLAVVGSKQAGLHKGRACIHVSCGEHFRAS